MCASVHTLECNLPSPPTKPFTPPPPLTPHPHLPPTYPPTPPPGKADRSDATIIRVRLPDLLVPEIRQLEFDKDTKQRLSMLALHQMLSVLTASTVYRTKSPLCRGRHGDCSNLLIPAHRSSRTAGSTETRAPPPAPDSNLSALMVVWITRFELIR